MQGEFAIIMPRIRGRTRGLLGPVAQSPCGLVLLDTTSGAASVVWDLCAEIELYARAANITTLRITLDSASGQDPATRRGAAEILSAISVLRSRGLRRIVVVCAAPAAHDRAQSFIQFGAARPSWGAWTALPDGVRMVVGLASAIGSVAEVTRGVAVVSAGPVEHMVTQDSALIQRRPDAAILSAAPQPVADRPLEPDSTTQLAHLLLTVPERGLEPRARAQAVTHLYGWITSTLDAMRSTPARSRSHNTLHARQARPARQCTWREALAYLDEQWEAILMSFAERDSARAEQAWAMTEQRIAAEGGYAIGAHVRAAPFVRLYLDVAAQCAWTLAYGAALGAVARRHRALLLHHSGDETPAGLPSEHAVS